MAECQTVVTNAKEVCRNKDNPSQVLMEHIISGDKGDGVPNILSDDDVFTGGKRQRPIRKTLVVEWKTKPPEEWVTGDMAGYIRNKKMVDLSQTPPIIKDEIILQYELQCRKNRSEVRGYFERNNLNRLLEMLLMIFDINMCSELHDGVTNEV